MSGAKVRLFVLLLAGVMACQTAPQRVAESEAQNSCPMPPPRVCNGAEWEVYFSPNGGATDNIVTHLDQAERTIFVQAYSFTSTPIAEALIRAHLRKVHVEVIVDKTQPNARGTVIPLLVNKGVSVFIDDKHAIAHNKVIILDEKIVFTGSFNFTKAGEQNNAENSIRLTSRVLAETYYENWEVHKKHSLNANH